MSNFYKDAMNIPIVGAEYGFNGVVDPEYARGHRDALVAASKIALDADVKIDGLEAQLAAAQADIKILQANVSYQIERNANNVADAELRIADLQAEITRLREGGCAREQATTQWCAEAQQLESRYRTLLVAIDECLSSNPQPLPRIVALLTDPLRNPSSGVMQVAKRGIAAELNVEDFDRDTARRMGLFDE